VTFSFPEINQKKYIFSSWEFNEDNHSGSSSTYDTVIGNVLRFFGESGIIMNLNEKMII
jgi:hypothetical protein